MLQMCGSPGYLVVLWSLASMAVSVVAVTLNAGSARRIPAVAWAALAVSLLTVAIGRAGTLQGYALVERFVGNTDPAVRELFRRQGRAEAMQCTKLALSVVPPSVVLAVVAVGLARRPVSARA